MVNKDVYKTLRESFVFCILSRQNTTVMC